MALKLKTVSKVDLKELPNSKILSDELEKMMYRNRFLCILRSIVFVLISGISSDNLVANSSNLWELDDS
ncbi:hypothetical protein [Streptococcus equinus]|uniref:hypothetical protein n=1 Tax=Streptococcus equinus TaxID=1335 RepID=UPI0030B900D2